MLASHTRVGPIQRAIRLPCSPLFVSAQSNPAGHFLAVQADPGTPVEGIAPGSPLHRTLLEDREDLDLQDAELQVLQAAQRLRCRHPEVNALVLECTNLPPYAHALRQRTGLPVWDVVTLLEGRMADLQRAV
jgi:hypothetical protein